MKKKTFDISKWREQEFLSIIEVGQILSVSYDTASALVHSLPHVRFGSVTRIARPALEKWIRDQERGTNK